MRQVAPGRSDYAFHARAQRQLSQGLILLACVTRAAIVTGEKDAGKTGGSTPRVGLLPAARNPFGPPSVAVLAAYWPGTR